MNAGWVDDCQSCCEFMYQHLYMWAQFTMGEIVNAGCDYDAIQRSLTIWGGSGTGLGLSGDGIFEYNNCHHKCNQNHGYGIGSHVFCNY